MGSVRKQQVVHWAFSMIEMGEERKGEVESQGDQVLTIQSGSKVP